MVFHLSGRFAIQIVENLDVSDFGGETRLLNVPTKVYQDENGTVTKTEFDGVREEHLDASGQVTMVTDLNGNVIERRDYRFFGDRLLNATITSHDALMTEVYLEDPIEERSRILSQRFGERSVTYEYTYDEVGNWVKRVKSVWVTNTDEPHWQATTATYRSFRYDE